MECNACMSLSLFNMHKCREKCMESNCPVCHDYLFDSSQPIKVKGDVGCQCRSYTEDMRACHLVFDVL